MPTFESMSSELQEELEGLCPDVHPRLRLHASHGFAIEGLMKIVNQLESSPVELRYRTRSEEHTSELQSLMRTSYAVFCLKKKKRTSTPRDSSQAELRLTRSQHTHVTDHLSETNHD